jgi:hypothetical protein
MRRKLFLILLGLAALAAGVYLAVVGWKLWRASKPTTTIARMRDLMGVLRTEDPGSLEQEAIRGLLTRHRRESAFADGWGHPFIVERTGAPEGSTIYRITSLGSDGKRGTCCRGFVDSFAEDAVLEGDAWLQQWSFGHPR